VVLVDGSAVLYVERGGRGLVTLPAFDDPATAGAGLATLAALVSDGRTRELVVARVDGLPVAGSPHRAALLDAGFVPAYRGLALRRPPGSNVMARRDGLHVD
jgi:ATP-dependent Lhr-like helicase